MSENKPDYITEALELIGIDLEKPREIIQEVSGFTPLFDCVIENYKDETRAAVHGAMWRFCRMQDGVCKASLSTIAEWIGVSVATVSRHAEALVEDGYFIDLTPDLRNRPHVYADTGKVVMKSKITAGFAQSKATVAQSKATVAQSRMSKDLNKDSNKEDGETPISDFPIDWKIAHGQEVTEDDLSAIDDKKRIDSANIIATGMGSLSIAAYNLAYAYMTARQIVIPESKAKGQRRAIREMIEMNVFPAHVVEAVQKLTSAGMTIVDLFSVSKTAIALANPAPEQSGMNPQGLQVGF